MIVDIELANAIKEMEFDKAVEFVMKHCPKMTHGYAVAIVEVVQNRKNPEVFNCPAGMKSVKVDYE